MLAESKMRYDGKRHINKRLVKPLPLRRVKRERPQLQVLDINEKSLLVIQQNVGSISNIQEHANRMVVEFQDLLNISVIYIPILHGIGETTFKVIKHIDD